MTTSQPFAQDPEAVAVFVAESHEAMQRCEKLLLEAESGAPRDDLAARLFRDVHTLKGNAAYFGYDKCHTLAHAAEGVLATILDKSCDATAAHYACLLQVVDCLRHIIEAVQAQSSEGSMDVVGLIAQLRALTPAAGDAAAPPRPASSAKAPEDDAVTRDTGPQERVDSADQTVRVNVAVLDRLMNLAGELVLTRNQVAQSIKSLGDEHSSIHAACQRLSAVTGDVQEQVMKTRMQPVSRVLEKIPRLVRDLCQLTGKLVDLTTTGGTTEIDRALVEAVRDPALHIIRNAIDHGLEPPQERLAAGKQATGTIAIRASHEGDMVAIEVQDDGRGMDPAALRRAAVQKGLLDEAAAARLSDREALQLIFRSGFSTASHVTDISGRGVGMDIVRSMVERVGGQVDLDTRVGVGTTVRLKLPLTMAIMPVMLVRVGTQRFAIPQTNLLELVYASAEDGSAAALGEVRGALIFRLRGEVLPVMRLSSILGIAAAPPDAGTDGTYIVIVSAGSRRYGLVVDAIENTEEVVIKPLHGQLKDISAFSGAAVLGDGGVAFILDAVGIATKSGIALSVQKAASLSVQQTALRDNSALVVFRVGSDSQCAVPLAMVVRLEQVPAQDLEHVAGVEVMQYRSGTLPIVRAETLLPLGTRQQGLAEQHLIVFEFGDMVAMAVDEIIDIVEVPHDAIHRDADIDYALGKTVILEKTTLLLDVYKIVRQIAPQFILERRQAERQLRVLVVDSSHAMRNALADYCRACGMDVVDVSTADAAMHTLAGGSFFDALVIDMALTDSHGQLFITVAKAHSPSVPIIAWANDGDALARQAALAAGAVGCVHKLEREQLMNAFSQLGITGRRNADRIDA